MADLLPFPPPVTGERRAVPPVDDDGYWRARFLAERSLRLRAEQVRDAYFDQLCEHADAIAEGRIVTPGMVWARIAFAVFATALLVWPISRMVP